jgi:predicted secreted protein
MHCNRTPLKLQQREVTVMRVMREQQNLSLLGQLGQYPQSGNGSFVIKGHQHVIEDHRAGADVGAIVLNVGKPESKEKLITSTVAHSRDVKVLIRT